MAMKKVISLIGLTTVKVYDMLTICTKANSRRCNKKKTTQQFIEEATLKHNGFYDYSRSEYKGANKLITITCSIHGDFDQTPSMHLQGRGCIKCAGCEKKTTQQFIEEATIKHDGFYDYSKVNYKNYKTNITITCPIHGDFDQRADKHLDGQNCKHCCDDSKTKSTKQFIEEATLKHNGFYSYQKSDYKGAKKDITITCPIHGDFDQRADHHILNGSGCPNCSYRISKPSQKWLDYLGIPNIMGETREVVFKLGNKKVVADGYNPQTNTIYEFHGDYWHGNSNKYDLNEINKVNNKTFGQLLQETQKRSRLIKSHGFNLVSIWESDWEKIEKKSLDNLKEVR